MRDKIKQAIKWIFFGRQVQFAISMIFQVLIMRLLSPEIYGIYALAVSALGIVAMFVSFGIAHSIIQFQKVEKIERNVLGAALLQALVYVVVTIPGCFIAGEVYGFEVARVYLLLIFAHAITFVSLVFQFSIERELDFRKTEIVLFVAKLVSVLVILGLALAGWGVYSLVAGFYVKVLLEVGLFFKYCRWTYGVGWNREVIRTVVVYASKRFLARGCGAMMGYLDKLILGLLVPVAYVGGYERGLFIISSALGLVGQIDARFTFSLINRIKDDTRKLVSLINKGTFLNFALAAAFALASVFYLQDLVILILGVQWEETSRVIPYFSIYLIAIIPASFIRQIFYAEKDPLHIVWGRLLEIAIFLLISLGIYKSVPSGDYSTPIYLMAANLGFSTLIGVSYLVLILLRLKQLQVGAFGKPVLLAGFSGLLGWSLTLIPGLPVLVRMTLVGVMYVGLLWKFCLPEFVWFKRFWQG